MASGTLFAGEINHIYGVAILINPITENLVGTGIYVAGVMIKRWKQQD